MAITSEEVAALKAELLADLKAVLKNEVVPMVAALAKEAVGAAQPVAAVVADPVIDIVDSYIMTMLGHSAPANAVAAPSDTQSQINQIAQHVAALSVATGKVSLPAKVGAVAAAPPAQAEAA